MSLDRPLYDEMVRRGSRGRWFWRAGDVLYYAGILGIALILAVWPVMFFFKFGRSGLFFPVALVAMGGVYMLGNFLKRISYRIALREGIDIVKFM